MKIIKIPKDISREERSFVFEKPVNNLHLNIVIKREKTNVHGRSTSEGTKQEFVGKMKKYEKRIDGTNIINRIEFLRLDFNTLNWVVGTLRVRLVW